MTKKYSKDNKKHHFEDSLEVFGKFYYDLLGYKLQVIGKKERNRPGWKPRWIVWDIHRERHRFVRAHWWRGNQR